MLSEVDIRDWEKTEPVEKLYNVPRNTVVSVEGTNLPFFFERLDGMYSICKEITGEVFHLASTSTVHIWKKKANAKTR